MMKNSASFQTGQDIRRIILFLHGYGANGEDLLDIGKCWQNSLPNTLFIAPNAPYSHPQIPSGYMWFDFKDINNITPEDIKGGLDRTRPIVQEYLRTLANKHGVTLADIIPVGFSQGSMITLDLLVHEPDIKNVIEYAGIYCPVQNFTENADLKRALLIHGTDDFVVPYEYMSKAEKELISIGIRVTSVTCPGLGHSISPEGIAAAESFLREIK